MSLPRAEASDCRHRSLSRSTAAVGETSSPGVCDSSPAANPSTPSSHMSMPSPPTQSKQMDRVRRQWDGPEGACAAEGRRRRSGVEEEAEEYEEEEYEDEQQQQEGKEGKDEEEDQEEEEEARKKKKSGEKYGSSQEKKKKSPGHKQRPQTQTQTQHHHHHHLYPRAAAVCAEDRRKQDNNPSNTDAEKSATGLSARKILHLDPDPAPNPDSDSDPDLGSETQTNIQTQNNTKSPMYWATDSQQQPPPSIRGEERIPIIGRRSSGEVEVLGWCSRARPPISTQNSNSPSPNTPLSPVASDDGGESPGSSRRNFSLPWTNFRLLPDYPVVASPSWSSASSSSSSSSSISSVNGDFGTFEQPIDDGEDHTEEEEEEEAVTWMSLPHKSQLIVLALCRLSEPLTQTSLSSYLYFLLASFHTPGTAPPSAGTISRQAGILASAFALAQCVTGVFWGRLSDRIGRKPCILLGLAGTTLSVIGFGFSESLPTALVFRVLGGCLNGNVGVLRTMVQEVVVEKRYHSRAFLILPMCFNVGIIIGPVLGGLLADPTVGWPGVFGGITWMERWRYALPNLVSAGFLAASWLAGFLFLRETHASKKHGRDIGIELRKSLARRATQLYHSLCGTLKGKQPAPKAGYKSIGDFSAASTVVADDEETALPPRPATIHTAFTPSKSQTPPFRSIFTPNTIAVLISFAILPLHNTTFMHLWAIFLSTPRAAPSSHLFAFTGGLGLQAPQVGLALGYLGILGIFLQLFCYPPLQSRIGLLRSYRLSCLIFPVAYILTPFLAKLHSTTPDLEKPASGALVWGGIGVVLILQVTARTFATPGGVILLSNAVERREVLGAVHGCATSLANASKAVGPVIGGALYAFGFETGVVGVVFWTMAGVAGVGAWRALYVQEGKGISEIEDGEEQRLLPGSAGKRREV